MTALAEPAADAAKRIGGLQADGCRPGLSNSAGMDGSAAPQLQVIAQERNRLQESKSMVVETLRRQQSELNSVRAALEREDAECKRLRQELLEAEAQAENLRQQLEERLIAIPRYAQKTAECRHTMDRLNALREQEQKLDAEQKQLPSTEKMK